MPSSGLFKDRFGPPWRFDWIQMLFKWDGGVLQLFWIEWLTAVALCAISMTIAYFALRDSPTEGLSDVITGLIDASTFVALRFQAAVALMLAFYSKLNFSRWKEAVNTEAEVEVDIHNLAIRIARKFQGTHGSRLSSLSPAAAKHFPSIATHNESADDIRNGRTRMDSSTMDAATVRTKLIRWLHLSHAIAIGDLCQMRTNKFSSLEKIRDFGLATDLEHDFLQTLQQTDKHIAPFVWFVDLLDDLKEQQEEELGVDDSFVSNLAGKVFDVRNKLEVLYSIHDTPVPLYYRQLTNIATRSYMAILLINAILHETSREDSLGYLTKGSFWFVMVFAWEYLLFVGWLTVADALGNPFQRWAEQLDWDWDMFVVDSVDLNALSISKSGFLCRQSSSDPQR